MIILVYSEHDTPAQLYKELQPKGSVTWAS